MAVYILKHPSMDFTGIVGGVDFYGGVGSTSSLRDARDLQRERGCVILDEHARSVEVTTTIHPEAHVEILATKAVDPVPVIETIKGEDAPAGASSPSLSPDAAALKAQEDNPDSEWSKRRAAEADKAKKKGGRRRR